MSDATNGVEKTLEVIETGLRRVARERGTADRALASLYKRLGTDDEDLAVLDGVVSEWHGQIVGMADAMSVFARRVGERASETPHLANTGSQGESGRLAKRGGRHARPRGRRPQGRG